MPDKDNELFDWLPEKQRDYFFSLIEQKVNNIFLEWAKELKKDISHREKLTSSEEEK